MRAGGSVVAVGLPSEMMELSIVKIILDGIRVVGSLVGTRQDLAEAFQFGADGIVVPVVKLRAVDEAPEGLQGDGRRHDYRPHGAGFRKPIRRRCPALAV